jgi:phosphoglucosamine mutase
LRVFTPLPQVLKNVRFANGGTPLEAPSVKAAIAAAEKRLTGAGRILVRKSGTEPLVRVMAEGEDAALVGHIVDDVVAAIAAASRT